MFISTCLVINTTGNIFLTLSSLQCRRFPWGRVVLVRDRVDSPPCWMRVPGQREAWKRGKARGGRGWGSEAKKFFLPLPLPPHFLFCLTPTILGHFFPIPNPLSSKNPRWRPIKMHSNALTKYACTAGYTLSERICSQKRTE